MYEYIFKLNYTIDLLWLRKAYTFAFLNLALNKNVEAALEVICKLCSFFFKIAYSIADVNRMTQKRSISLIILSPKKKIFSWVKKKSSMSNIFSYEKSMEYEKYFYRWLGKNSKSHLKDRVIEESMKKYRNVWKLFFFFVYFNWIF